MQRGSGELREAISSGRSGPSQGKGVATGDKAGARGREANRLVCESARPKPSIPVQQSPEYAFSVERRGDQASKNTGSLTLVVGVVHLVEVLTDSGAN